MCHTQGYNIYKMRKNSVASYHFFHCIMKSKPFMSHSFMYFSLQDLVCVASVATPAVPAKLNVAS